MQKVMVCHGHVIIQPWLLHRVDEVSVVLETKNPVEMMKPEDEALHLEDERQDVAPDGMAYADKTKRRLRSKQLPAVTYAESFLRVFRIGAHEGLVNGSNTSNVATDWGGAGQ